MNTAEKGQEETPLQLLVELDHTIGFNANTSQPLHFLQPISNQVANSTAVTNSEQKTNEDKSRHDYVCAAGSDLILSRFGKPHEQAFLHGHKQNITACAMSPNKQWLASVESGETPDICVWKFEGNGIPVRETYRLEEHMKGVRLLAFSDDNRFLASVGDKADRSLYIWDMETGYIVTSHAVQPLPCHDFSWGGRVKDMKKRPTTDYLFATCGENEVRIWGLTPKTGNLVSSKCVTSLRRTFQCLSFSPTRDLLIAGTNTGDFVIFDVKQLKSVGCYQSCIGGISSISCQPMVQYPPEYYESIHPQLYIRILAGGGDGSVADWNYDHQTETYVSNTSVKLDSSVTSIKVDDSQQNALVGTAEGSIYRLDGHNIQKLALESTNETNDISKISFLASDSNQFLTCARNGFLKLWNASDYSIGLTHKPSSMSDSTATSLDMNEEFIVVGWENGDLRAHNTNESNDELWTIKDSHKAGVTAVGISDNDKYIVSAGNGGSLRVWDIRYRNLVAHMKEHKQKITGLAMYDDSRHVLSCSRDRSFICWDLAVKKSISCHRQQMGGMNDIVLSPNQQLVVTVAQDRAVTYWDIRQREPVHKIENAHDVSANIVQMSNDGRLVGTSGGDNLIKLWDLRRHKLLAHKYGHSNGVNGMAFSPDCKQLVSVGNGTIMLWNLYT